MSDSRLSPEIDIEELSTEEAFEILGDETRLDIIRSLWEAGALREHDDVYDKAKTISFSELLRRVDIDDNGKFNYHLSKLVPHFVLRTDEGYRLSSPGKKIARTVVAISGDNPDISDETDIDCPLCGSTVEVAYEDRWLRFTCTECDGLFGDRAPEGMVFNSPFPPHAISDTTPEEALATGIFRCILDMRYMIQGMCRECGGYVTGSVSVCDNHNNHDGNCETCGSPFKAWGEVKCGNCRFTKRLPTEICVMSLSPVAGFLYFQEVDIFSASVEEALEIIRNWTSTSVTENPLRVNTTITSGDDEITVLLDENLNVTDISL